MENEFSVYQFFKNDTCECVARFVSAEEAMKKATFFTTNVSANCGLTQRVIITDSGDFTNWEWQFGKGVVFPTEKDLKNGKDSENH